ncbi:MAG: hypothetical protein SVR08_18715, partial [Spirochaetota bacterium]|nr:hypothetical protein [Spirochaetota bacterium]
RTDVYIKMCDMACDLQKSFKENIENNIYVRWYDKNKMEIHHIVTEKNLQLPDSAVVLFTQEQIENILCPNCVPLTLMERIVSVWRWEKEYWAIFETFEQFWFAFLMKDKFELVWNEIQEDWVKVIK